MVAMLATYRHPSAKIAGLYRLLTLLFLEKHPSYRFEGIVKRIKLQNRIGVGTIKHICLKVFIDNVLDE
tara:strand:+ start:23 stop:229 length:207 start_codon:yes stop_codon:yes gene_type:complete